MRDVYLFGNGLLKAGETGDAGRVGGVDEQGHKGLLAMEERYRESTVAWG